MTYIILKNSVQCKKCKDIIESLHGHDYVTCSCGACSVDGGKDYLRRLGVDYIDLSEVTSEDEDDWFERVRSTFTWKSYGKSGTEQAKVSILKDMETAHIKNILKTQYHIHGTYVESWLKLELQRRLDD